MRVAVAFDHAVRRAALAACLSSDDTSITALAERSQRWPRGREQMRRRGVATVAATAGSSQPIKAQSLVSVLTPVICHFLVRTEKIGSPD